MKKVPMENASQSSSQSLKIKYLDLLKKMRTNKENLTQRDSEEMDNLIRNTESLFLQIKKPWDLKLDARISNESAKISSVSFEKQCMSDRMTTEKFVELVLKHKQSSISTIEDYLQFAKSRFVGVEFVHQLCLKPVARETHQRQRCTAKVEDTSADFPLRIFSAEDDDGTLTLVKKIKKVVYEMREVDYYRLVIDPKSYSRTVENIFYLAFAVKVGLVHFASRDGRFLVCAEQEAVCDSLNHLVVSMEYGEYCMLVEKLKVSEALFT